MNKNLSIVMILVIFLTVIIIGIGCKANTETATSTAKETIGEEVSSEETKAEEKPITIGMAIKRAGVPYEQAFMNGAKDRADELGINIIFKDSNDDNEAALNIMDSFITQKIDAYIHLSTSSQIACIPGIIKMNEAGIPVGVIDAYVDTSGGGKVEIYVNVGNVVGGSKAAEAFIRDIKERNGGNVPEGVVLQIVCDPAITWDQEITQGFHEVIDQYPQISVAEGIAQYDNVHSQEVTSDLLTRYEDEVIGIYVNTPEVLGVGAVTAIEGLGLDPKDYSISGFCMGPEARDAISAGKILCATHHASYDVAYLIVGYMYDVIKGVPLPEVGDTIVDEEAEWKSANVVPYPGSDYGVYIELGSSVVGLKPWMDMKPDDPRLWENKIDQWGDIE